MWLGSGPGFGGPVKVLVWSGHELSRLEFRVFGRPGSIDLVVIALGYRGPHGFSGGDFHGVGRTLAATVHA